MRAKAGKGNMLDRTTCFGTGVRRNSTDAVITRLNQILYVKYVRAASDFFHNFLLDVQERFA